jgi:prephenate dehydratase
MDAMMDASYAYLGPQGTYSHEAALFFSGRNAANAELIECPSISEVFELVDRGRTTYGVVPIENSLEGSVNETLDAFAFTSGAHILAETVVDIHHNLIAPEGVGLAAIQSIASHPQALGQTRRWLLAHLPAASTIATASTAEGVRSALADPAGTTAAIGTTLATQLFGGSIIQEQIEDHFGNQTRFVLIGNKPEAAEAPLKTSLTLFMHEDRPGTLLMILSEFSYAGVNLTKIQSRPTKRALGDYMFWIDIEGSSDDVHVKAALDCLRLKLREVKVVGSYPTLPYSS